MYVLQIFWIGIAFENSVFHRIRHIGVNLLFAIGAGLLQSQQVRELCATPLALDREQGSYADCNQWYEMGLYPAYLAMIYLLSKFLWHYSFEQTA